MTKNEVTSHAIPLLPSSSIHETEKFYVALGAITTYKQKVPNNYIAFRLWNIDIHFFSLKQSPADNYSTCYMVVPDIDKLYKESRAALKALYGKIPLKGHPRINPLKDIPAYGARQFIIVDPSGNYIRIGQPIEQTDSLVFSEKGKPAQQGSPLARAYELGSRLADGRGDFEAAARALDKALAAPDGGDPADLLKVLILRADIAARMSDNDRFKDSIQAAEQLFSTLPDGMHAEERRLLDELKSA
ncbi:hypothetical protein ACWKWU_14965 [Chitinophaga lutea]